MRMEIIECKCRKTANRRAPWAAAFMKVEGGFMAFESYTDYKTAKAAR